MKPASSDSPQPPSPSRRPRRWLRALGWLGLGAVTLGIVAWQMRLSLVRKALARALPEFPAQIESIEWTRGGLEITGLKLTDGPSQKPWLELPSAHLTVNPLKFASGELGEITLNHLQAHLTPEILQRLQRPQAASGKTPAAFHLSGLHIKDAALDVALPSGETAALVLNWEGGAASLSGAGLQAERQTISLQQVNLQPDATTPGAHAAAITLTCSADAATRQVTVHHLRTNELSAQAGAALWKVLGIGRPSATSPAVEPLVVQTLKMEDVIIGPMAVKFEKLPWLPKLPPGQGQVSLKAHDLITSLTTGPVSGTADFSLTDFRLGEATGPPLLTLPQMTAAAEAGPSGSWRITTFALEPTAVSLTTAQLSSFGLEGWVPALELSGTLSAKAQDLRLESGRLTSSAVQEIALDAVNVTRPGASQPLLRWESLTAAGHWEEISTSKRIRRITWIKPQILLTGEDLAALQPPEPAPVEAPSAELPAWHGWRCDDPSISGGHFEARELGGSTPNFTTDFSLEPTLANWLVVLDEVSVSTPGSPKAPALYRAQQVEVEVNPSQLWQQRRIERVTARSSRFQVGANDSDSQIPEAALEQAQAPQNLTQQVELDLGPQPLDWHIGNLELANTKIYIHHLVPDAPEILLPLAHKRLRNLPLTAEGLRQSDAAERIELPFVYVPGTRVGTSVADFDTNFVHFSLAGLMRKEIELVELVNPKIYVGDSLFHYVDKLRSQSPTPAAPAVVEMRSLMASLIALVGDAPAPTGPLPPSGPGWKVNRLKAMAGQLITTVKDSPMLRVPPLPFGADSSVREGRINAQLAVPPGLYKPLLGTELVVAISEGAIVFNLPMKQKDNNLVQVFRADWLRYKQFRMSDVTLQVTYDKNGVYARFWAKAYQGDLEGAFNLYLDDNLSWDMWLAGINLETKEITTTLTPAYYSMTGPLSGKIIAQGDKTSLYQATGEFSNRTSGRIKILALEDAIKAIPADWSDVERKAVTKLLETLRDFAYDKCTGTLRFYGLEGEIRLQLKGPDGERNFDIFSHDRRLSDK
jgi:hypothetical protein